MINEELRSAFEKMSEGRFSFIGFETIFLVDPDPRQLLPSSRQFITALGRQDKWEASPKGYPQTKPYEWWIWHDELNPDSDTPGLAQLRAYRDSLKGAAK